jgi:predicted phosphodiesterase
LRIAVISDIHGNWHALEAVLDDVKRAGVDEVWCLGDIVGYGPQPNRCVEETRARSDLCLLGNHDLAAIGDVDLATFSPDAATSARWTIDVLEPESVDYLRTLEPKGEREGVQLFHASPRDPIWEYVLSEPVVRAALELTTSKVVLVGHSHIPIALRLTDGDALAGGLARAGSEIELTEGRWLMNPGSVGQPRDGDPRAAYLLVDLGAEKAEYRRIAYNIGATQAEIRKAGLPEALADRLDSGE